jgi:preprotein translocase subunit SecE
MSQDNKSAGESPVLEHRKDSANIGEKARRYVADVRLEMRQVSWPTWNQVRSTTLVVLFFTFAMAAFLRVIDGIAEYLYWLVVGK